MRRVRAGGMRRVGARMRMTPLSRGVIGNKKAAYYQQEED
jgi:hypothetical protein